MLSASHSRKKSQVLLKFIPKLHLVYLPFELMDILNSRLWGVGGGGENLTQHRVGARC